MNASRSSAGFTLIELLVGVFILVILTVISISLFTNVNQEINTSSAANGLNDTLLYARSEAVKRNANIYVSFVTGSSWCYGVNVGSTCTCTTAGSCGLTTVSAPNSSQTSLSATGLSSGSIYFEGTHGAANASATMTFTVVGGSSLVTLTLSRLGSIQMCSTGIGGYTAC